MATVPDPIDYLNAKLNSFKRALMKSKEAFDKKKINKATHEIHKENLMPIIQKYQNAVNVLLIYG